jgi:hypothetical protein
MTESRSYPFTPVSNAQLLPGHFWAIGLSDGRFACGRVLRLSKPEKGLPNIFVAGLLDWVGSEPPTQEAIAGAPVVDFGNTPIDTIQIAGDGILGHRDLESDGIVAPADKDIKLLWGPTMANVFAERRFVEGIRTPQWGYRDIRSPLTPEMLSPFTPPAGTVSVKDMLTDSEFMQLADWLRNYPHLRLSIGDSLDRSVTNLEFLRFFPFIKQFSAYPLYRSLKTLDGLRHLSPDLDSLFIGETQAKLDLTVLGRFAGLRKLNLEGQTKGIDAISKLINLEELTLRSITLPDLSLLQPMTGLRALEIKLGGTKDLGSLPKIPSVEYLELVMVRGLTDLTPVGGLPRLRYLSLRALRRVEELPDFSMTAELRRVHMQLMKGLRDLLPLATAPALEQLLLIEMWHLEPEDLRCLVGLPHLRGLVADLGSRRKYEAVQEFLQVPEASSLKHGWRDVCDI